MSGEPISALGPAEADATLAQELIECADELRQMYTDFGLRPYRAFMVRLRWTGSEIGAGQAEEISRKEILPTPLLEDLTGVRHRASEVGLQEDGSVRLVQVSLSISEDELRGLELGPLEANEEFFYEIVEDESVPGATRRRFFPVAVPYKKKDAFYWTVPLTRQHLDMARNGDQQDPI